MKKILVSLVLLMSVMASAQSVTSSDDIAAVKASGPRLVMVDLKNKKVSQADVAKYLSLNENCASAARVLAKYLTNADVVKRTSKLSELSGHKPMYVVIKPYKDYWEISLVTTKDEIGNAMKSKSAGAVLASDDFSIDYRLPIYMWDTLNEILEAAENSFKVKQKAIEASKSFSSGPVKTELIEELGHAG